MTQILSCLNEYRNAIIFAVLAIVIGSVVNLIITRLINGFGSSRAVPISHKMAVLGLPTAGKTTLITAMFDLIQKGVPSGDARLHGTDTIYTVNRNIMQLASGEVVGPSSTIVENKVSRPSSGEAMGPTAEGDIFVFRFSYVQRKLGPIARLFLVPDTYDVEIADFPGQFTEQMSVSDVDRKRANQFEARAFGGTLFGKEFFSWIASSSQYIFLIDLAAIYSSSNVQKAIAEISARIRTSWQIIEDATSDRDIGDPRKRSVHIVFSKLDVLVHLKEAGFSLGDLCRSQVDIPNERQLKLSNFRDEIIQSRLKENLARAVPYDDHLISEIVNENGTLFLDLVSFFQARVRKVDSIYTSMLISESDGTRLGVRKVLEATLP